MKKKKEEKEEEFDRAKGSVNLDQWMLKLRFLRVGRALGSNRHAIFPIRQMMSENTHSKLRKKGGKCGFARRKPTFLGGLGGIEKGVRSGS